MKKICYYLFISFTYLYSCSGVTDTDGEPALSFNSSNERLTHAFDWAKEKALSYAHDGSDPVGYWYEAALPNREAFCMRDVSHQAIGAEILGLSKHNYNMLLQFAKNISKEKDYCSYWEINRYDQPAPVDYENDKDFWYNLPANFDVIYAANRVRKWTGNQAYLENTDFTNFYKLSLNEYVEHWKLGSIKVNDRDRSMHLKDSSRFGKNRGIPTYSEGGRGETRMGIDMTASLIAGYLAYAEILQTQGEEERSGRYLELAQQEKEFLNRFWWDSLKQEFRSIQYEDQSFDHFMVGENQAFLHYLLYFNAITDLEKSNGIVEQYVINYSRLIVELKSYLPIIFYEFGYSNVATQMIIDLCSTDNKRRDYPENSFTVIEHITRGLMGIEVDATTNSFSTLSRINDPNAWAEITGVSLLTNKISVHHFGNSKTIATNQHGESLLWEARLPGTHRYLLINGKKTEATSRTSIGQDYSFVKVELATGARVTITLL